MGGIPALCSKGDPVKDGLNLHEEILLYLVVLIEALLDVDIDFLVEFLELPQLLSQERVHPLLLLQLKVQAINLLVQTLLLYYQGLIEPGDAIRFLPVLEIGQRLSVIMCF